jgi:hypothetical protein
MPGITLQNRVSTNHTYKDANTLAFDVVVASPATAPGAVSFNSIFCCNAAVHRRVRPSTTELHSQALQSAAGGRLRRQRRPRHQRAASAAASAPAAAAATVAVTAGAAATLQLGQGGSSQKGSKAPLCP